jgi:hypothetical protein
MDNEQLRQIIREEVALINAERAISASHTSNHTHNGIDSPLLAGAPQVLPSATLGNLIIALQKLNLIK